MYKQRGLSLIELMISLTLGIVLMTGVVQMFLTSRMTYNTQQAISRIQESGRMAVDFLASDVRMAGYMGCGSRNPNLTNGLDSPLDDYLYNFDVAIEGKAGASFGPASENTDVLIVRRASGDATTLVEEPTTGGNARIRVSGKPYQQSPSVYCLLDGALCDDDVAILSDCSQSRVFRATNVTTVSAGGASGQINHTPSSPGGGQGSSDLPTNLDSQLGGQQFTPGAEVLAFNTIAYYIAPSAFSPGGGVEVMSLWRRVGERDPAELVEGVENLRVEYGLDTTDNKIPDTYRLTENMSGNDWENVQAVRLHLLLQGPEPNVLPEPQTLNFAGTDQTFDDGRMRQVFTSTVGIRGRLQ